MDIMLDAGSRSGHKEAPVTSSGTPGKVCKITLIIN